MNSYEGQEEYFYPLVVALCVALLVTIILTICIKSSMTFVMPVIWFCHQLDWGKFGHFAIVKIPLLLCLLVTCWKLNKWTILMSESALSGSRASNYVQVTVFHVVLYDRVPWHHDMADCHAEAVMPVHDITLPQVNRSQFVPSHCSVFSSKNGSKFLMNQNTYLCTSSWFI